MANDWTAQLSLNAAPYIQNIRRVESESVRAGEKASKAFGMPEIQRGIILLGALRATTTILAASMAESSAVIAASMDSSASSAEKAQLRIRDAWISTANAVPFVGGLVVALYNKFSGRDQIEAGIARLDRYEQGLNALQLAAGRAATAAHRTMMELAGAPKSVINAADRADEVRALEQSLGGAWAAGQAARLTADQIRAQMALIRTNIALAATANAAKFAAEQAAEFGQRLTAQAQVSLDAAQTVADFIRLESAQAEAALVSETNAAVAAVRSLNLIATQETEMLAQVWAAYYRKRADMIQADLEKQDDAVAQGQAAADRATADYVAHDREMYARRQALAEQFISRIQSLEAERIASAESYEERRFSRGTAGMNQQQRDLAARQMAESYYSRASAAYTQGNLPETQRLLGKSQQYLEMGGMQDWSAKVQVMLDRLYQMQMDQARTGLAEAKKQPGPEVRPVQVDAINITVSQKLTRDEIRTVVVDELKRLQSRGRG